MAIKFGYILSCWHHCQYVEQCIESIRNQMVSTEIILFGEKCSHNFKNVKCINDGKHRGQIVRLNQGLGIIQSDYISFMGVDDYLFQIDPRRTVLKEVEKGILESGKKEWYYGTHFQLKDSKFKWKDVNLFDIDKLKTRNYIAGGAVFVRMDILKQYGFEEVFGLGGDWILWNKLAQKYKPVELKIPIYIERIGTSHIRIPGMRAVRRMLVRREILKII